MFIKELLRFVYIIWSKIFPNNLNFIMPPKKSYKTSVQTNKNTKEAPLD